MNIVKDGVKSILNKLPDDSSLEDVQYHLYVLDKIKKGIDRTDNEGAFSQDEVEKRLSQ